MKSKIAIVLMILMLVMIVPVYAQETTAEPTEPTTTSAEVQETEPEVRPVAGVAEQENQGLGGGATTLVLLVGLGAIVVVGFGAYLRANGRAPEL